MPASFEHWNVSPRLGMGSLRFGMARSEADRLADIYGVIVKSASDRIPDSILQDTLAQFGDGLSEEQKRELLAVYAAAGPDETSLTEIRGDHGLVLRYEKDRLVELTLSATHGAASLNGIALFGAPGRDALAAAERLNGGPGLFDGSGAMFDTISIVFEGFSHLDKRGNLSLLDDRDDRFRSRSVGVFEQWMPDEGTDFKRISVLDP